MKRAWPVVRTLVRRFGELLIFLVVTASVLFGLLRASGNPAAVLAGQNATPAQLAAISHHYGFDKSIPLQYLTFVGNIFRLHFGLSLQEQQPALSIVLHRLPATLGLVCAAFILNVAIALPAGLFFGSARSKRVRGLGTGAAFIAQGIPYYVLGLVLIQLFVVQVHIFNSVGDGSPSLWVLPSVSLAWLLAPRLFRVISGSVQDELKRDYIKVARCAGHSYAVTVVRDVFPNAILAGIAYASAQFGYLVSGTLLVEVIFAWPGIGNLLVTSVQALDFPVVEAAVTLIAIIVYAGNSIADLLVNVADPRIRGAALAGARDRDRRRGRLVARLRIGGRRGVALADDLAAQPVIVERTRRPFMASAREEAGRVAGSVRELRWSSVRGMVAERLERRTRRSGGGALIAFGLVVLIGIVVVGVFHGAVGPFNPSNGTLTEKLQPPLTHGHLLGTNELGQDTLSRLLAGIPWSLGVAALAAVIGAAIGGILGAVGGFSRSWPRTAVRRMVDFGISMPALVIVVAILALAGSGVVAVAVTLGAVSWPLFARVIGTEVSALRERDFVLASELFGGSTLRTIWRHVVPGVSRTFLVLFAMSVGDLLLATAALSYLGLGAPVTSATWGNMLTDGQEYLFTDPWIMASAAFALCLTVVAVNALVEGMTIRSRGARRLARSGSATTPSQPVVAQASTTTSVGVGESG